MKIKLLNDGREKTFAVVMNDGDEVMANLASFAKEHGLAGSHFTGIGALREAMLGYFDWEKKDYKSIPVQEQVEVLSLVGDITLTENGDSKVHAHIVLGRESGAAIGGHLLEARVRPTLELIVTESPEHLRRRFDQISQLALIDL
jgi:predicted DNA-binding protein with PD1-like motif